jgi:hypothetical protein
VRLKVVMTLLKQPPWTVLDLRPSRMYMIGKIT